MSAFPDIWLFDVNLPLYDAKGIYLGRGDWSKRKVVSETRGSWVLSSGTKIRKKGPWFNVAFSQTEVDQRLWIDRNRYKIGEAVSSLQFDDLAKLKAVAEILGYEPKAPA